MKWMENDSSEFKEIRGSSGLDDIKKWEITIYI